MISPNKTEHRALNTLEAIIDEHATMDHQFNGNDKEMSWDGYIWLYKGDTGNQSKKSFDGRVPVQIKGHTDTEQKFIGKEKINYPVDIDDLRAFATEKGVLYFQIFINSKERGVFYSSLYPSRVADYLALAQSNGNSSTISIPFIKLDQQPEKLYIVAKQFDDEAKKQGSAYTPLVKNRIRSDEFEKLRSVNLSVVGASDTLSILRGLSSGDICLYGKTDGDRFDRPIEWHDNSKFYAGREVVQSISIDGEEYYKKYRCIADSDGGMELILSPNLRINLTAGNCHYKVVSTLKELYVDARFLLKLYESQSFSIAQHVIKYADPKMTGDFRKRLLYIVDLFETLEMIGFDTNTRISEYTDKQQTQFLEIVNIRLGAYNNRLPDGISKYLWHFGGKCVPILITKHEDKNELFNAVYTKKMAVFLPYEDDGISKGYRVPLFIYQDVEVLGNLYSYDYESFRQQINESDINENTASALLDCVLKMINVFDFCEDHHFLDMAENLLKRISVWIEKPLSILNECQIKKRKSGLSASDLKEIAEIKDDSDFIQFGKSVLLGDKKSAELYFDRFTPEMKDFYKTFPIYKLFLDL